MAVAPRLFLITPPLADAAAFAPLLEAAVAAADIACLLIRTAARDEQAVKSIVRPLAPIAQARDVAVLVEDPRLAARLEVDGVHLDGIRLDQTGEGLDEALGALKPRKIVGVGGLDGRDAAMTAGERGADYVMFGRPDGGADHDAIRDTVAWWAEIFNVPCVGYAREPAHASDLAEAGAEFVALCEGLWDQPDALVATLRHLHGSIAAMALP